MEITSKRGMAVLAACAVGILLWALLALGQGTNNQASIPFPSDDATGMLITEIRPDGSTNWIPVSVTLGNMLGNQQFDVVKLDRGTNQFIVTAWYANNRQAPWFQTNVICTNDWWAGTNAAATLEAAATNAPPALSCIQTNSLGIDTNAADPLASVWIPGPGTYNIYYQSQGATFLYVTWNFTNAVDCTFPSWPGTSNYAATNISNP